MVRVALNLANKFTTKAISGLILFVRYNSASMVLSYEYSDPNTSSPWRGRNRSVSFSNALTIMGVLDV
jgi:hypothetical protein